ncbi:HU family DNA-binding protein [Chitinophaga sp. MM2321]|uniref:HU family DNA-binding protein n=1 Tax=Chitinophaga sp. MM2321 TaxID=3137178 RepID=UPI0032D59405
MATEAGITKSAAALVIDAVVSAVASTLKKGESVTLPGLGTFSVSKRAARNGRNPQTGQTIRIKAKKVASFKAGKVLSEKIR